MNAPVSISESARLDLAADIQKAKAELTAKHEAERKRYLQSCLSGECDEWPEMLDESEKRDAILDIASALRRDPEYALLHIGLILNELCQKAAQTQADICERNGWPE